jgi:hypothetical protein
MESICLFQIGFKISDVSPKRVMTQVKIQVSVVGRGWQIVMGFSC